MPLLRLLVTTPLAAISLCVCLTTLLWCILLVARLRGSHDRFLVGLVGLVSIYHSGRLLRDSGLWNNPIDAVFDQISSFAITSLFLVAIVILEIYTTENRNNAWRLRLAEANEAVTPVLQVPASSLPAHDLSQAVIESSPLPMFAVDPSGAVCYWNPAAERLFGWEREEVLGRPLPLVADGNDGSQVRRESSCCLRKRDGTCIQAEVWTAPIQRGGDGARGTLTIVGTHRAALI
jgi:PAS domain S-box-containing protein